MAGLYRLLHIFDGLLQPTSMIIESAYADSFTGYADQWNNTVTGWAAVHTPWWDKWVNLLIA
jgi:hypothetical protein